MSGVRVMLKDVTYPTWHNNTCFPNCFVLTGLSKYFTDDSLYSLKLLNVSISNLRASLIWVGIVPLIWFCDAAIIDVALSKYGVLWSNAQRAVLKSIWCDCSLWLFRNSTHWLWFTFPCTLTDLLWPVTGDPKMYGVYVLKLEPKYEGGQKFIVVLPIQRYLQPVLNLEVYQIVDWSHFFFHYSSKTLSHVPSALPTVGDLEDPLCVKLSSPLTGSRSGLENCVAYLSWIRLCYCMTDQVDKEQYMWYCGQMSGSTEVCLNIDTKISVSQTMDVTERLKTMNCVRGPGSEALQIRRNNPLGSTWFCFATISNVSKHVSLDLVEAFEVFGNVSIEEFVDWLVHKMHPLGLCEWALFLYPISEYSVKGPTQML